MKKRTNEKHVYTQPEVDELSKCAKDVIYFCKNELLTFQI